MKTSTSTTTDTMTATEKKNQSAQAHRTFEWKDIPLRYQYILSTVLIFFAAILLFPAPEVDKNAPIFQSARDEVSVVKVQHEMKLY